VVVGGEEGDMMDYFHSLQQVIKYQPQVIFPSHGIAQGGTNRLEEVLQHRIKREEQIRDLLKLKKNEETILDLVYQDLDSRLRPYALKNIRSHIKKILREEDT
jgi:glyoxylase-like metal-dependent hydrolase (beta-lactamase superfamily II)